MRIYQVFFIAASLAVVAYSQQCIDELPSGSCSKVFCRFFQNVRDRCRKSCGGCATGPSFDSWTTCSKSCDSGTRFRVRSCPLNSFDRCPREYQDCSTQQCPRVNCQNSEQHRYNVMSSCCRRRNNEQCGVQADVSARIIGGSSANLEMWPWMRRVRSVPSTQIVGGSPAVRGMWQWMVRLELQNGQGTSICGAVLLNNQWILTAAHCIINFNVNQIRAYIGYGTRNQMEVGISSFTTHPDYNIPANDIAVAKLSRTVQFNEHVRSLCLPNGESTPDDTKCFIAGWGVTNVQTQAIATDLQEARIRILPYRVCFDANRNRPFAARLSSTTQICAGTIAGGVDSCGGDSGGPIMCQRRNSCTWYAAGIVSIGPNNCGSPNDPGLYTKVASYQSWIEQQIA